jgi:hypothetical protein
MWQAYHKINAAQLKNQLQVTQSRGKRPTDARGVLSAEKRSGRADIRHHFVINYPSGYPMLQNAVGAYVCCCYC